MVSGSASWLPRNPRRRPAQADHVALPRPADDRQRHPRVQQADGRRLLPVEGKGAGRFGQAQEGRVLQHVLGPHPALLPVLPQDVQPAVRRLIGKERLAIFEGEHGLRVKGRRGPDGQRLAQHDRLVRNLAGKLEVPLVVLLGRNPLRAGDRAERHQNQQTGKNSFHW